MHDLLRKLDLNLLLVFDALHRHRSVVAAADELSISPSACSHALSRLRGALSDDLFIRHGNGMQPTVQADLLAGGISDALSLLSDRLASTGPFIPQASTQTFTFAATDFSAFAMLPALISSLEREAPHLHVKMIYETKFDSLEDLANGRVQFVIGFANEHRKATEGIQSLDCMTDDYVVAARADHPRIQHVMTLDKYLAERHVAATPWSDIGSVVDLALSKYNLSRDVAVKLPSLMAAPLIVAKTDYLITLPRQAALHFQAAAGLEIYPTPFTIPNCVLRVYFHIRHMVQPGHRWLREKMLAILPTSEDSQ